MLQSMPDAAGTHRLLQGLPQAERHAFIATLSPQSRSNLMAYIAALERDLAQMKQAFSSEELTGGVQRTGVQAISEDGCSDVGSSSSDSLMDGPSGCAAELQDELHVLLRQKELLESRLAKTQALSSQLATSLAGCDLYGKVCEELVDSEEVELSQWEESSTSSELVERSRPESGNETLGSLMHALQNASPEERRKAVADISQERFMQLISSMPEDEEVDLQGGVSFVDDLDGTWIDPDAVDMTESHPSSLRRHSAAEAEAPDECSALCLSSNKPSEPRNTKPLGQLQVDGELPAHESTHVLLRLPPRSRAHNAAAELSSAWERCLGKPHREQGVGSLKDSGVDGEAISAWLGGETSSTMCCARILEATVRGNYCSAPAQKEMSRTVELYGRGETGGAGCLGGCLGALVGGLAGLCLPEDAAAGELMSEMLPSRGLPQEPAQAVASAAKVLAADGFDTEAVNFEFRRQCLQAHPQRRLGGLSHFLQVHCDLEVLRQTAKLLQSRASTPDDREGAGATAAKAAALAQAELDRTDSQAVEASALLSPSELEEQNEQMSRYLLDLSWQKDAMKAMLEHLQNHEAYAVLDVTPDISDGDLAKAYKAAAMRLHPDKGGNAEQFKDGCDMVESGSNLPVRLACLDITCASRESRLLEPGSTRGL
ncbi:dnaJ [Symbiodinium microadriaticum]|nr:dnaJ [Symbiodinium microadriaticum]